MPVNYLFSSKRIKIVYAALLVLSLIFIMHLLQRESFTSISFRPEDFLDPLMDRCPNSNSFTTERQDNSKWIIVTSGYESNEKIRSYGDFKLLIVDTLLKENSTPFLSYNTHFNKYILAKISAICMQ